MKIYKINKLLNNAVIIANKFGFDLTLDEIAARYSEDHRFWHTLKHLYDMLDGIEDIFLDKKINTKEYEILIMSAIFHDIIYDTKRTDNEEKSVDYMMSKLIKKNLSWSQNEDIKKITTIILNTKTHDSKESLSKKFNKLDTLILDSQFIDMLDWENKIYKEFKWVGWKQYKKKRIQFLLRSIKDHTHNVINIKNLIDYINNKILKIGICYYEIDKLPTIDNYINDINKINDLFDNVLILIIFNKNNYSKELIKEYGIVSKNNEFYALSEDDVMSYLSHQNGNITIIKELKYMNKYNTDIEKYITKNFEHFRTIFI